jgi:4-amino-4-deoxy-L-arabinose transferase-like glycosyltransferase
MTTTEEAPLETLPVVDDETIWNVGPPPSGASPLLPRAPRVPRFVRGRAEDPAWVRPALLLLLAATAALYIWDLGASGWANSYYSAAVQAGAYSWKAFLFGSSDASNFITVDKTPAFLWPMELTARVFGVNSWSILVPQALEGVAAVGLLYAAVKRWFGAAAGLLAGTVLALTPVAALMFRFNNPDALLTLTMVAAAWAMTRALDDPRTRWLVLSGACIGFGFLAKELQVLLAVPALGLVYLVAGPPRLGRRIMQLVAFCATIVAAAGWWVALVVLTPAGSRPYIGGSQNNSFWNVLFGYNGFGRLSGNETGSVGGQVGNAGPSWGPTGWTRMFNSQFGTQISWLLPAALVLLVGTLVWTARRSRTDRLRASMILWGGWLIVTGVAFSLGKGIIHEYYTVALAPAIGAIIGIGATTMWRHRAQLLPRVTLAVALGVTAWWTGELLDRAPSWYPSLHWPLVVGGFVLAFLLLVGASHWRGPIAFAVGAAALVAGLAAPAAATLTTVGTAHAGAIPLAGPATTNAGGFGRPGGFAGRFGGNGGLPRLFFGGNDGAFNPFGGRTGNGNGNGFGSPPGFNPFGNSTGNGTGTNNGLPSFFGGNGGRRGVFGRGGGGGGLLDAGTPPAAVTSLLRSGKAGHRWAAATVGANNAAGYQLASNEPIMAIGGFNGSDPAPTLAQFEAYVRSGAIHYYIDSGGGFGPALGARGTSSDIASWVRQHFTSENVGGVTIYDLTQPSQ